MRIFLIIFLGLTAYSLGYIFVTFWGSEILWMVKAEALVKCALLTTSVILLICRSRYASAPYFIHYTIILVSFAVKLPPLTLMNAAPVIIGAIIGLAFFYPSIRKPKTVACA